MMGGLPRSEVGQAGLSPCLAGTTLTGCVVIVQTLNLSDLDCKIGLLSGFVRCFAQTSSSAAIWGISWVTRCQGC